jgi:hypothetical protein
MEWLSLDLNGFIHSCSSVLDFKHNFRQQRRPILFELRFVPWSEHNFCMPFPVLHLFRSVILWNKKLSLLFLDGLLCNNLFRNFCSLYLELGLDSCLIRQSIFNVERLASISNSFWLQPDCTVIQFRVWQLLHIVNVRVLRVGRFWAFRISCSFSSAELLGCRSWSGDYFRALSWMKYHILFIK